MNQLTQESEIQLKDLILQFGKRAVEEFNNEEVGGLTPARTDNYLSLISAYSSQLEERLGELEMEQAKWYGTNREKYKSSVETDRYWDATDEGLEMIKLKRTLKAVDKIIAACKNRLNRLNNEARNNY